MATCIRPRLLSRGIRHAAHPEHGLGRRRVSTAATAVEYHDPEPIIPDSSPPPSAPALPDRRQAVQNAKPFSDFLTDTFSRQHDYLRISVTERCNLRCLYCMPEDGIDLAPKRELLTTPEIVYLSALFVNQGVTKIRLTGGEPTVRKDIVPLMQQIGSLRRNGLKELALTTNGISLHRKLDKMVESGLTGVNISLDTLDPFQFQLLTRRQGFEAVTKSIQRIQDMNKAGAGIKLKINAVVMRGLNDHQILPFVEKTRAEDIEVRFIEYMPFDGNKWSQNKMLPYQEMLDVIRQQYPDIGRLQGAKNDTSKTWQVPGFKGRVGFITSMTHNFCGTCNRLRITSDGNLKVCLHGETEVSLRDLLRQDLGGDPMDDAAFDALRQLELDQRQDGISGLKFDGEETPTATESRLLEVIGQAVKRKKAMHAGMGVLENLKNRPMIKIGGLSSSHSPSDQSPSTVPDDSLKSERKDSSHEEAAFAFQSLSGLFHQPEQKPRYSRPRDTEDESQRDSRVARVDSSSDGVRRERNEGEARVDPTFFRASDTANSQATSANVSSQRTPRVGSAPKTPESTTSGDVGAMGPASVQSTPDGSSRGGRGFAKSKEQRRRRIAAMVRHHINKTQVASQPRSEATQVVTKLSHDRTDATQASRRSTQPERPWGMSREDIETLNSMIEPERSTVGGAGASSPKKSPSTSTGTAAATTSTAPSHGKVLTHLNSAGEARMVDVGAKKATRRVAVATTFVFFSNPEPSRLIAENSNRKGDVLSVARVAGIMAAKRTSDLIPLCHPIPISKIEVDLEQCPRPDTRKPHERGETTSEANDAIRITSLVECHGPTGVEMEALTSVMGAALTVFDMCKAVDRDMSIASSKVEYKSGGRSGLHCTQTWAAKKGKEWFEERGLEVPDISNIGNKAKEGTKLRRPRRG